MPELLHRVFNKRTLLLVPTLLSLLGPACNRVDMNIVNCKGEPKAAEVIRLNVNDGDIVNIQQTEIKRVGKGLQIEKLDYITNIVISPDNPATISYQQLAHDTPTTITATLRPSLSGSDNLDLSVQVTCNNQ